MKEKDLYTEYKDHEMILYAEKEDESYGEMASGSYAVKNYLGELLKYKESLDTTLRNDLKEGKISPLFYFMLMQDIGQGDLAKRVGISKCKLRKQLKPEKFSKLPDRVLEKYAVVFGVTIAQIKEFNTH
jgi:hypothetical protein